MIKHSVSRNVLFGLSLLMLLSGHGCDGSFQTWEPPSTIERENAYRLGELLSWPTPDRWIFLASSGREPIVLAYNISSEEVEIISTPDIITFPHVALAPNGEMIAYNMHSAENEISIHDINRNEQIFSVEGSEPAFSFDNKKLSVWRDNELFVINLETKKETMVYQIDEREWEESEIRRGFTLWNPINDKIAFVFENENRDWGRMIILVDPISGKSTPLVSQASSISGLSWSPDGRLLAYGSKLGLKDKAKLTILDIDNHCTVAEIQLSDTFVPIAFWSPDGSSILYEELGGIKIMDIIEYFGVGYEELVCEN